MSADEGKEEYDEVQQDLRKRDEEVRNALKNKFYLSKICFLLYFFFRHVFSYNYASLYFYIAISEL